MNDYPVVESVSSILPLVDEMIVLIGDCEDNTEELIRSIASDKIKIHHSVWDPSLRKGGSVLAVETDKAFQLISADSDWAFYIQADEVVHEKYHPSIIEACRKYKDNKQVEGLLFEYLHFYGTYDYVGDSRRWYDHEIRIIRNDRSIKAYRDAQGFRKNGQKLYVKPVDACIYHYGWVKSPAQMRKKMANVGTLWHNDEDMKAFMHTVDVFDFNDFDSLVPFTGAHPTVMHERIKNAGWKLTIDTTRKHFSFKDRVLYFIEKKTGKRLFDYINYRILK